eukprot:57044_1
MSEPEHIPTVQSEIAMYDSISNQNSAEHVGNTIRDELSSVPSSYPTQSDHLRMLMDRYSPDFDQKSEIEIGTDMPATDNMSTIVNESPPTIEMMTSVEVPVDSPRAIETPTEISDEIPVVNETPSGKPTVTEIPSSNFHPFGHVDISALSAARTQINKMQPVTIKTVSEHSHHSDYFDSDLSDSATSDIATSPTIGQTPNPIISKFATFGLDNSAGFETSDNAPQSNQFDNSDQNMFPNSGIPADRETHSGNQYQQPGDIPREPQSAEHMSPRQSDTNRECETPAFEELNSADLSKYPTATPTQSPMILNDDVPPISSSEQMSPFPTRGATNSNENQPQNSTEPQKIATTTSPDTTQDLNSSHLSTFNESAGDISQFSDNVTISSTSTHSQNPSQISQIATTTPPVTTQDL